MGGSGGYFRSDPKSTLRQLRDAQDNTRNEAYEAETASLLASFVTAYNDRDHEAISRHLDEIRTALEKELDGTIDLKFGGSVAKHTYIDGFSDVDSLVLLDNCELSGGTPEAAKKYLVERLRERFPRVPVEAGRLAVTVSFSDVEIQLLPAVSCRSHVKIADSTGADWAAIRPREFTRVLTATNEATSQKVVPVIKLAKAIIANLAEPHRISGYHTEALAVDVFRSYTGPTRPKDMLKHFFDRSAQRVTRPITDLTGQSTHVDDYLGGPSSLPRKVVADAFARVARRMTNADATGRTEDWRSLFGD